MASGYAQQLREYRGLTFIDEEPDSAASDNPDDGIARLAIDGLVVDETETRLGRTFYDVFYQQWQAPKGAFNYTVTVQEQPVPNFGTRVSIRVSGEVAFQARLQPRDELIEGAARQAVYFVRRHLENRAARPETY